MFCSFVCYIFIDCQEQQNIFIDYKMRAYAVVKKPSPQKGQHIIKLNKQFPTFSIETIPHNIDISLRRYKVPINQHQLQLKGSHFKIIENNKFQIQQIQQNRPQKNDFHEQKIKHILGQHILPTNTFSRLSNEINTIQKKRLFQQIPQTPAYSKRNNESYQQNSQMDHSFVTPIKKNLNYDQQEFTNQKIMRQTLNSHLQNRIFPTHQIDKVRQFQSEKQESIKVRGRGEKNQMPLNQGEQMINQISPNIAHLINNHNQYPRHRIFEQFPFPEMSTPRQKQKDRKIQPQQANQSKKNQTSIVSKPKINITVFSMKTIPVFDL